MQINKLIEMEELEEAHLNLLSLRQEFQEEQCGEVEGSMEQSKKEKDLQLLYRKLRDKVKTIVRDSSSLPSRNKGHLVSVARLVQEEERRDGEPGGLAEPGGWREVWREAVGEGALVIVDGVHLDAPDQNSAWLAVHLGQLGQTIVQDLERVKRDLRGSYPPSFKVFSTYVRSYHRVVAQHLKMLKQQVKELKDILALLNWILNHYQSERIMGSPSLRPEMQSESTELVLDQDFLDQLKDQCCSQVQRVQGLVSSTRTVDVHLENKLIHACVEELVKFPKRFEEALMSSYNSTEDNPLTPTLWAKYLNTSINNFTTLHKHHLHHLHQQLHHTTVSTTYTTSINSSPHYTHHTTVSTTYTTSINSFTTLQQHMEQYRVRCSGPVADFSQEVNSLLERQAHSLEEQYNNDIKLYMRRMMTRKWLTNDEDFQKLSRRVELLSEQCSQMRPPTVQVLVDRLHHHTVKDYISRLMNSSYSCKNRKHEGAARKLREQWWKMNNLFIDMLHYNYTTTTLHHHYNYTTTTLQLHRHYTTTTPTTTTPPLHYNYTATTLQLHHHYTTTTPPLQLHRHYTTPPLHYNTTTTTPPLQLHHHYNYNYTTTLQLHRHYTTTTPPLQLHRHYNYTATTLQLHRHYNYTATTLHRHYNYTTTTTTPPLHYNYTTTTLQLHRHYNYTATTLQLQLHHHYTTTTPPLHYNYTTTTLQLHHHYTTTTPPLHYNYTTTTLQLHRHYTTTTPPLHYNYTTTTTTPPLH
ncbi:hypothetical protein NHX12_020008 [Muraenolepis orangiensis]|uniref:Exocyst complex component Sec6 n=1 Tax=Muraenolepis orangiensis TaxID=630683 RepID=A0A9Q0EUH7_9TELE|nr:hypothetical protein NHX12_020008 [Muraenolepis orangiensis]